jgi:uncharacterized delta-60 repeat protein
VLVTSGADIGLVRYLPNGGLDPTFGNLGKSLTDLGFDDVANSVALTPTGGILIAGYTVGANQNQDSCSPASAPTAPSTSASATSGGSPPTSAAATTFAEVLTLDDPGGIILIGRAASSTIADMAVAQYNADGTLARGITTVDFHGRGDFGQDLALDADDRIVAGGYTANGVDTEFARMQQPLAALGVRPALTTET